MTEAKGKANCTVDKGILFKAKEMKINISRVLELALVKRIAKVQGFDKRIEKQLSLCNRCNESFDLKQMKVFCQRCLYDLKERTWRKEVIVLCPECLKKDEEEGGLKEAGARIKLSASRFKAYFLAEYVKLKNRVPDIKFS